MTRLHTTHARARRFSHQLLPHKQNTKTNASPARARPCARVFVCPEYQRVGCHVRRPLLCVDTSVTSRVSVVVCGEGYMLSADPRGVSRACLSVSHTLDRVQAR